MASRDDRDPHGLSFEQHHRQAFAIAVGRRDAGDSENASTLHIFANAIMAEPACEGDGSSALSRELFERGA